MQSSPSPSPPPLATDAHVSYIQSLNTHTDEYEYWLTEHLRLNGVYWGNASLHLLGRPDGLPRAETLAFVLSCWHPDSGGFGAAPGHDAHMLSTVSAIQVLVMLDGSRYVVSEPLPEVIARVRRHRAEVVAMCHALEAGTPVDGGTADVTPLRLLHTEEG